MCTVHREHFVYTLFDIKMLTALPFESDIEVSFQIKLCLWCYLLLVG